MSTKQPRPAQTRPSQPPAALTASAATVPDQLRRSREAAWERLITRI